MSLRSCRARIARSASNAVAAISTHLHPDALGLREFVQRRLAPVAAGAGMVDAAVRARRVVLLVRVDPGGSATERARRAVGGRQVVGPDAGGQPVLDVIGDPVG